MHIRPSVLVAPVNFHLLWSLMSLALSQVNLFHRRLHARLGTLGLKQPEWL